MILLSFVNDATKNALKRKKKEKKLKKKSKLVTKNEWHTYIYR